MDPEDVKKKITAKTKAIMAVHLYGHPCEMDALSLICKEQGIFLIEDCAEAIGSKYKGKNVGTFGDVATFSFFGNKTITTGEGGMVATNDETLYDRVVHFKGQGLAKHREYWHDVIGYNYRMTNICAAIGLAQLERVDIFLHSKQKIAKKYKEAFQDSNIEFHQSHPDVTHSYWMCSILVHDANDRDKLRNHLVLDEIETRPFFYPVHTMPMYAKNFQRLATAEDLAWRGINLPSYPGLEDQQIKYIVDSIKKYYN